MAENKPFGKIPVRSLESFGVAGILGEESKIFYSSIFTTKHLGRVTDLIAAKLQDEGLDELKLRALVMFGTFEVFRSQVSADGVEKGQRLAEPLVIECGLDEDKIALGVSFTADDGRFPQLEGLAQRVSDKSPQSEFERLLIEINAHSDRVYVRAQASIRRLEIVALLGISDKIDAESVSEREPLMVVEIAADKKAGPPKVKAYIELGDLDYPELLKEDTASQAATSPATGEVLMHGFSETDDAIRIRAENLLAAMTGQRVAGGQAGDDVVRIKGGGPEADGPMLKMTSGGAMQAGSEGTILVKGVAPAGGPAAGYQVKTHASTVADAAESEDGDDEENKASNILDRVKSAWPFRFGKSKKETPEEDDEEEEASVVEKPKKLKRPKKVATQVATEDVNNADEEDDGSAAPPPLPSFPISTADIEKDAQKLTKEIEGGIEQTIARAQAEAGELRNELGTPRAKRWVDGLMTELVAEKAKLAEASKELNTSIRQKEHEFRSRESMLTEELKRRDELIRQKTSALERAKDQLSQVAMSAERLKSAAAGAADDAHYKQKHAFLQKMMSSAKEENVALTEKIEDLKAQLNSVQNLSKQRNQPSVADFTALQSKYERSIRQADEFKKANQVLVDKLNEAKKEALSLKVTPQDDTRRRLESAVKISAGHQRDAEKLQIRVEEMQREQTKLRGELARTAQELKSARLASKAQHAVTAPAAAAKPAKVATLLPPRTAAVPAKKPGSEGGGSSPPQAA